MAKATVAGIRDGQSHAKPGERGQRAASTPGGAKRSATYHNAPNSSEVRTMKLSAQVDLIVMLGIAGTTRWFNCLYLLCVDAFQDGQCIGL